MLEARHPVAFFANGIGDHLLALPAIRALSCLFNGRLSLICMEGAGDTFFSDLPLRSIFETKMYDNGKRREFDAPAAAENIGTCDFFVSINPWHSLSVDRLLEALAPKASLGFFPAFKRTLALNYRKHSADLAFDVPRKLQRTLCFEDFAQPPQLPPRAHQLSRRLRGHLPRAMRVLAVHTETSPEKMWPQERFAEVLDRFLERHPEFIAIVVDSCPSGLDRGRRRDQIILSHGLPLTAALSIVGESDCFLGIDSCMLHAADLYRVPGVGLFGPTNCDEWGFRLSAHRHVCGHRKMTGIRTDHVLAALESLLTPT